MSEQMTETRSQRREREAAEQAAAEQAAAEQAAAEQTGEQPSEPQPELTEAQKAEQAAIAAVEGFSLAGDVAEDGSFAKETTPVRNRQPVQRAMDAVAARAYADWVAADRPTLWQKMPVITYFLDPDQVSDYRKMINRAAQLIVAEPYEKDGNAVEPSGARVRFGKEFVLTEKMAEKIGKPEQAGKTVLAWAVLDKRNVTRGTADA